MTAFLYYQAKNTVHKRVPYFFMLRGQDLNLKEARGVGKRIVSPFRYKKMYENA